MPKPREIAREQRRAARALAVRDALRSLRALSPSLPLPTDDARSAYRTQVGRMLMWFSRAHTATAALSDRPGSEGEPEPDR